MVLFIREQLAKYRFWKNWPPLSLSHCDSSLQQLGFFVRFELSDLGGKSKTSFPLHLSKSTPQEPSNCTFSPMMNHQPIAFLHHQEYISQRLIEFKAAHSSLGRRHYILHTTAWCRARWHWQFMASATSEHPGDRQQEPVPKVCLPRYAFWYVGRRHMSHRVRAALPFGMTLGLKLLLYSGRRK